MLYLRKKFIVQHQCMILNITTVTDEYLNQPAVHGCFQNFKLQV